MSIGRILYLGGTLHLRRRGTLAKTLALDLTRDADRASEPHMDRPND